MKILKFIKFAFFSITVYAFFFACQTSIKAQEYLPPEEGTNVAENAPNVIPPNENAPAPESRNAINGWGYSVPPANVPTDLVGTIINITNFILGFVALIATLIIIYGGLLYLTSMGNDDRRAQASKTISSGIIGLIITGLAYAIVIIVINILMT